MLERLWYGAILTSRSRTKETTEWTGSDQGERLKAVSDVERGADGDGDVDCVGLEDNDAWLWREQYSGEP